MERGVEDLARIVLAVEGGEVAEEVMHFLDRTGSARVVAAAADRLQLTEAIRQTEPDVVVASPRLAPTRSELNGSILLALDTAETVRSLRSALDAGARGFFLWPDERDRLARAAGRHRTTTTSTDGTPARAIAVYGPRGGVGTTFVAVHLAAAMATHRRCVLADLDLAFADVTGAIGVPSDEEVRTIADLAPLGDEVGTEDVRSVLWSHPAGFEVLLSPAQGSPVAGEGPGIGATISALAAGGGTMLLHLPRFPGPAVRAGMAAADRVLVVVTLDVASLRAARRAVESLGIEDRCWVVVNRARRSAITPGDVERVFGQPPAAVIPADRAVPSAQDRGRLIPLRGRTGRALRRLAVRLAEDAA